MSNGVPEMKLYDVVCFFKGIFDVKICIDMLDIVRLDFFRDMFCQFTKLRRSGVHPRDHDGFMKVVLNDESTEALAKAHTLPRWDVSATMTRGVKGPKGIISKAKANPKGAKRKAEGTDSSAKAAKASKKPTAAQVLKEVAEAEAGAEATSSKTVPEQRFTRSQKGREAIKMKFEKLVKLDSLMFKQNPSFSLDGLCRMKYPVAEGLSMQQMSDSIASCFEGMCLGMTWH